LNVKRNVTFFAPGYNADDLDLDHCSGRNRIAAHQLEAERKRLRNYGRKLPDLKFNLIYALQPMPFRFIDDDLKQALRNSEFVQSTPSLI
jgi:hypothetical protein